MPNPKPAPRVAPVVSSAAPTPISGNLEKSTRFKVGLLTPEALTGLTEYQSGVYGSKIGGYTTLQEFLRNGTLDPYGTKLKKEEIQAFITGVDQALEASKLTSPTILFRGVNDARTIFGDNLENLKPGFTYTDPGFTSTSAKESIAKGKFAKQYDRKSKPFLIKIEVPEGSRAFNMSTVLNKEEAEVLLPRGSKFEIKSVRKDVVTVRLIEDKPPVKTLPIVDTTVKTANVELQDALIRQQIYLQRYSGYVSNNVAGILNNTEEELARRIRDRLSSLAGLRTPVEWQRLEALQATIKAIRMEAWDEATKFLSNEMVQLSYKEPVQLDTIFKTVLPVTIETVIPTAGMLKAIALARPFEGRILKEWADTMAADDIRRIHSSIQAGMVAGEDMATIARRVVGTGTLKGIDGVTEITRRQVQAITRTAVQHVANNARDTYFSENADLITAEQFVATLDSRTTAICRSYDGQAFELGKGPRPPLHFSCRSLRIAAIDGTLAGDRPAKPATKKMLVQEYADKNGLGNISSREDLPRGTKGDFDKWSRGRIRELVGPIPATTNYQEWLKGQSKAFQDEVLGVAKGKLFRDGGLTLDKFVHRSGDELTLGELAQKHAEAFRAAGLDPAKY